MKNVLLIGMPAAGKSTVGVLVAKALGMNFCDTDLEIQQAVGETLQENIDKNGIAAFLKTEGEVCCSLNLKNCVIATGGSVVLSKEAMAHLKRDAVTVFLDVSLPYIKKRLKNITSRGIAMQKGDTLDSVFEIRQPLYELYSDITVKTDTLALEETVEEIVNLIKKG